MCDANATLLIVDNDPAIRFSLCQILRNMGHAVRTAEDGFYALQEMNSSIPDILLSDLNMPRMSGFELLSVVRRRFPSIYVIGMTGAFIDRLPPGIAADAFYRKASGVATLFQLIETGAATDRLAVLASRKSAPIWIPIPTDPQSGKSLPKQVFIGCPECLRAFPQVSDVVGEPRETFCTHYLAPVHFAVVEQYV